MIDKNIINRVDAGKESEYRPLSAYRDLRKAGIAGLAEHGISPDQFDKMTPTEQNEWAHEMETDSYKSMRSSHRRGVDKHITNKKYY